MDIHDSTSTRVQRGCEDGGSSDSMADVCTDASAVIMDIHDSMYTRVQRSSEDGGSSDSDASAVIMDIHDSTSTRVQRGCEDGGSSDSMADVCSDASAVIMDIHDSTSTRVQRGCEDGGSSDSVVDEKCLPSLILCAEEECDCQPLHKSSVEQGVTNLQQICLREQCVFTGNVKQEGDNRNGALLSRKNMQQDILAGNTVNGNCVKDMAEEINETYTVFADGVATGSHAWNCTSTQSIGDQNMNALRNVECMGDAERNEVESSASEILPASEVDGLDSSDKFSALRQAHLRDTGLSNYHEVETLVISDDDNSDASTVIIDNHDCMSIGVQEICEDSGSSDSMVVACTDEDEGM
jgi:hypothetical protein